MTDAPTNNISDAIAEEIHRRSARLAELREEGPERTLIEVRGEIIGLRGALGIALGHRVPGGAADAAGINYYEEWLARQHSALSEAHQ
jgi:hypothetical protein